MAGDYTRRRRHFEDVSGSQAATTSTLATAKASHSIALQKAHFQVTGAAAGSWELKDANDGQLTGPFDTSVDGSHWDMDFGPEGVRLPEGLNLKCVTTGGATGIVSWEAFQKPTSLLTLPASWLDRSDRR